MPQLAKKNKISYSIATRSELANLLKTTSAYIQNVSKHKPKHYGYFELTKVNGDVRPIQPPKHKLKLLQREILECLYNSFKIPTYLHGGLPKKSAISHAKVHVGKQMVATLDVRNFYPSISSELIFPVFEQAGFSGQALSDIIELSTLNNSLPQGSPTSCLLANLSFLPVDKSLRKVCRNHKLKYSRFVDDMAISGNHNFENLKGPFISIIKSAGFDIAPEKSFFMPQGQRQCVTGLIVNEKLRPSKEYISSLKHDLHLCLTHGPLFLANAEGITVKKLQAQLNGRRSHINQCDKKNGQKLKDLMYGIEWQQDCLELSSI